MDVDPICRRQNPIQLLRDDDHRNARTRFGNRLEQVVDHRCGRPLDRFVEHEQNDITGQGVGDSDRSRFAARDARGFPVVSPGQFGVGPRDLIARPRPALAAAALHQTHLDVSLTTQLAE